MAKVSSIVEWWNKKHQRTLIEDNEKLKIDKQAKHRELDELNSNFNKSYKTVFNAIETLTLPHCGGYEDFRNVAEMIDRLITLREVFREVSDMTRDLIVDKEVN